MPTTTDLSNRVFWKLGGAEDESPNTDQDTLIKDAYSEVYAELYYHPDSLARWPESNIPKQVMGPVCALVAFRLIDAFQVDLEQVSRIRAQVEGAWAQLKRVQVVTSETHQPMTPNYF